MSSLAGIVLPHPSESADHARLRREAWAAWRRILEGQRWRSTPAGPRPQDGGRITEGAIRAFALAMRAAGLYRHGYRNTIEVRRVELELTCPGLPRPFDGFRILHVTDPHFDLCDGLADAINEAVAGSPADICVLTGDYRAACSGPHRQAIDALERLLPCLDTPLGVWATLGNHDCLDMVEPIEGLGIRLLINETATLRRGEAELRLVGLDDVHTFHTPLADEALAFHAPADPRVFALALVHSPDMASRAARLGYGLYLCGHTHGGQICLPGGRPLMTHLDSHRAYARGGGWRIGAMHGYTSCGAGASSVPLRYWTQSEVTRVTLKCGTG